jgi:serine/threonine protein kinase/WD40 repeat protein/tetratricopeptide (TPR) repeat protein
MSPISQVSDNDRNPVEVLAEEFVERQRQGEHPSLLEYMERYPELAEEIHDLFPALVMVERLKPAADELPGRFGDRADRLTAGVGEAAGRLGDFRLLREVARGGMGVVYEAVQESLGRHVALKILPGAGRLTPAEIERFQLEARSAGRLHHGHIVPVYGVGECQGMHYYAMQFIQGHGLDAILDDLRRLRGLDGAGAEIRDDGTWPASADRTGSLTLACSLLTGGSRKGEAATGPIAAPTATIAGTSLGPPAATPPTAGHARPAMDGPASDLEERGPPPPGPSPAPADDSALSLAGESQFYRSVARIGAQVADALAYAHQQGILHRDIKPSNLLLDVGGDVWVTDFGLAKVEGSDGPTRTGDVVGTARYMAPERFEGWSDRRSDVYSLGATLYELLTLRPLFPGVAQAELIERVLHDAPDRPRKLDPKIPRDLETIVLKAIAKEPAHRYPTAQALHDDLQRFLDDRPILARRSTSVEQSWRWCRRNPLPAAALSTAAAAVVALAVVSTLMAWTFRDQRDLIRKAETQTRANLFDALTAQARATRFSRRQGQRFESLEALARAARIARELGLPREDLDRLRDEAIASLALPDLKPDGRVIRRPPGLTMFAIDPAMTRYALRFRDGTIEVRSVADDREIARLQARGDGPTSIFDFSPDGRYLATTHYPDYALSAWDLGKPAVAVDDAGIVHAAQFGPDSRRLALVREDRARHLHELVLYDLATGQPGRRWRLPGPGRLAFRPDGARIAVDDNRSGPPTCRIFETETGRPVETITLPAVSDCNAWSPDGTTLAIGAVDFKIYLWDAATGVRKGALEGHTNAGLRAAFHPAGAPLASNGWEHRLWLWDPVLGRPWLSVTSATWLAFSRDGRLIVSLEETFQPYRVDPAREYRSLAHAAKQSIRYGATSIRHDGRVLAVGTTQGVALWDLARGVELAFLPIEYASNIKIAASGDLLTSGSIGAWRWPIRLDLDRAEFRIGPPHRLPLPQGNHGFDVDESGRIVALAHGADAHVLTAERAIDVGPLDDVRSVAVSPDGAWLATGSHGRNGAQVWRVRDARRVADLAIEGLIGVVFSPDGRWLMTSAPPCRLWSVGTWRESLTIAGSRGLAFSPGGHLLVVQDASAIVRLVDTSTGRTVARLESPDLHVAGGVTFSPDGSRLVVTTNDGPAMHVWDLRAIRRRLADMGLDWDAPSYPEEDPAAPSAPDLPPLRVDYGPLAGHIEPFTEPAEAIAQRCGTRLGADPGDVEALHSRGQALLRLNRPGEAIDDFTRAIRLRPGDAHFLADRGEAYFSMGRYDAAIDDLEASLARQPDQPVVRAMLARTCNDRAWALATGPGPGHDLGRALALSRRAVALDPGHAAALNTLGVVQYRAGRYAEAIETLERSLAAGQGHADGWDLFFLAMAHQGLGHRDEARNCLDRGVHWLHDHSGLTDQQAKELAAFRAEAETALAVPGCELPADVFAGPL